MNRWRRFILGATAGYVTTAANLLYTAVSVPLALHFLPKAEFALWAIVVQVCGYLMLLDLGISSSVSRFLADYKDSMNAGEYGNLIKTGRLVLGIQAAGVFFLTLACAWFLPSFLEIPGPLQDKFHLLLVVNGSIQAVGLALRAETAPLWAHQRIDITHWVISASLFVSFASMALGFWAGWGIYSYLFGSALGGVVSWSLGLVACHCLHLYPEQRGSGSFQKSLFLRMLGFGSDVLLMQLGALLCSGSQILLVTKLLGLEAAAVFSVATKTLTMMQQLLGRILESAAPGLTEIFVRGDRARFIKRFYQMVLAISVLTLVATTAMILANRLFVDVWTRGKIVWNSGGDICLGILLLLSMLTRALQGSFGMSGDYSKIRFLPLTEGVLFIILALAAGGRFGLTGILASAFVSQLLISLFPTILKVRQEFPSREFWSRFACFTTAAAGWCLVTSIFSIQIDPQTCSRVSLVFIFGWIILSFFVAGPLVLSPEDRRYFKRTIISLLWPQAR